MDSSSQYALIEIQLLKKRRILSAVQRLQLLAAALVFLTILVAYSRTLTPTHVFVSFLSFLLIQVFATREYTELAQVTRRIKILSGGPYFPHQPANIPWKIPAGAAVRDGYFFLVLFFDVAWLAHAYLYPSPAGSYDLFLQRLSIGPISGTAFVVFTILLWVFYAWLFLVGSLYADELNSLDNPVNFTTPGGTGLVSKEVWIRVKPNNEEEIYLQGRNLHNPGKQPLILWPGFFQNGYVYDLSEGASLARYLWESGFDVWIIHPRGTAGSDGRWNPASLDDFASDDVPAVIDYVCSKTGQKPVFVGHSQGGISAVISLMGATKPTGSTVSLSAEAAGKRQQALKGLVVLGSFLDFSFSKPSWLKSFVKEGLCIKLGKAKWSLLSSGSLLKLTKSFVFLGTPFSFALRMALLQQKKMRILLFPLTLFVNSIALLKLWEFLYHIPNVSASNRKALFYKTMDGTFNGILRQFHFAVANDEMRSINGEVNYSGNYHRLTLPVSVVAMEFDALADPAMMKGKMFDSIGSARKFFTLWKGMGHEDHFTDPAYFSQVLDAIKLVC